MSLCHPAMLEARECREKDVGLPTGPSSQPEEGSIRQSWDNWSDQLRKKIKFKPNGGEKEIYESILVTDKKTGREHLLPDCLSGAILKRSRLDEQSSSVFPQAAC